MNITEAHRRAMLAKEAVFKAQDATSLAWDGATDSERKLLRKIEKRLAKVRFELEQLDNDVRGAR